MVMLSQKDTKVVPWLFHNQYIQSNDDDPIHHAKLRLASWTGPDICQLIIHSSASIDIDHKQRSSSFPIEEIASNCVGRWPTQSSIIKLRQSLTQSPFKHFSLNNYTRYIISRTQIIKRAQVGRQVSTAHNLHEKKPSQSRIVCQ